MPKYRPPKKRRLQELPEKYKAGFLGRMDCRTALGQRLDATYNEIVADCGGAEVMPYAKLCLVERFCFLHEFLRKIELEIAEDPVGKGDLLARWTQATNVMLGIGKMLGAGEARGRDWIADTLYSDPREGNGQTPHQKPQGGV